MEVEFNLKDVGLWRNKSSIRIVICQIPTSVVTPIFVIWSEDCANTPLTLHITQYLSSMSNHEKQAPETL